VGLIFSQIFYYLSVFLREAGLVAGFFSDTFFSVDLAAGLALVLAVGFCSALASGAFLTFALISLAVTFSAFFSSAISANLVSIAFVAFSTSIS
jgi:hypothetical protein